MPSDHFHVSLEAFQPTKDVASFALSTLIFPFGSMLKHLLYVCFCEVSVSGKQQEIEQTSNHYCWCTAS